MWSKLKKFNRFRLKEFTATFLVLLSFLLVSTVPVEAAVKPGSTCKKLGITSTASGKTYTCIKAGKKLVWSKGKLIASPSPSAKAVSGPSFETAKIFADKLSSAKDSNSRNVYITSESIKLDQVQFFIDIQEKFVDFWSNEGVKFTKPITTYFFTEKDRNWLSNYNIPYSCIYGNWFTDQFKYQADGKTCQTNDKSSLILIPIGSGYLAQTANFKTWGTEVAAHEIEHVVQNEVFNYLMPDPCWFREGLTTYSVWINTSFDNNFETMKSLKKRTFENLIKNLSKSELQINGKKYLNWTNLEWLEILNYQPANPVCWGRNMDGTVASNPIFFGYAAGPFIVEKLYIDFGLKKAVEFMYQVGLKNNFYSAFSESFGVEYSDWMLKKAIPWLLAGG